MIAQAAQIVESAATCETVVRATPLSTVEVPVSPLAFVPRDELNELVRLERREAAVALLKGHEALRDVDVVFLRWCAGALLRADGGDEAVRNWRAIGERAGVVGPRFTPAQERALTLRPVEVRALFWMVHSGLATTSASELQARVLARVGGLYGHRWNDAYEARLREKPGRSLASLRHSGVQITVPAEDVVCLRREYVPDAHCPVIERVKNQRIVTINGFTGSKTSLTVHDMFDHYWAYDLLDHRGVFDRYAGFLARVGNPHRTDIFKREGELIASPVFQWRSTKNAEKDYTPLFRAEHVARRLRRACSQPAHSAPAGYARQRALNIGTALRVVLGWAAGSREAHVLGSVVSGAAVELMEQRRKHGFIRDLGPTNGGAATPETPGTPGMPEMSPILPLAEAEYLALIVEILELLGDPANAADQMLFNTSALVEEYLVRLATGQTDAPLVVRLTDIAAFDVARSALDATQVAWLRGNLGFAATKGLLCD